MGCFEGSSIVVVAAFFSLVQGVIWIILSSLSVVLYNCKIKVTESGGLSYQLYLLYFFNKECGEPPQFIKDLQSSWPKEDVYTSERTHSISITYLLGCSLWIVSSIALAVSVLRSRKNYTQPAWYIYFVWIFFTIMVLMTDVVALSMAIYDLTKTTSMDGMLDLLAVDHINPRWRSNVPVYFKENPAAATVVMLMVCSRFVVLWFIDLALLVTVIRSARRSELIKRKNEGTADEGGSKEERQVEMQQLTAPGEEDAAVEKTVMEERPVDVGKRDAEEVRQEDTLQTSAIDKVDLESESAKEDDKEDSQDQEPDLEIRVKADPEQDEDRKRSAAVNRLTSFKAPKGLQNQMPWRYPVPNNGDAARTRSTSVEKPPVPKKPRGESITETKDES